MSARKRSWPAVSQICRTMILLLMEMCFSENSNPTVVLAPMQNLFSTYLDMTLLFPTPLSPSSQHWYRLVLPLYTFFSSCRSLRPSFDSPYNLYKIYHLHSPSSFYLTKRGKSIFRRSLLEWGIPTRFYWGYNCKNMSDKEEEKSTEIIGISANTSAAMGFT